MNRTPRVVVIGGGIGGCAAALALADARADVTLLESSPHLGGLVVSFEVGGTPLECFYHHVFPHELHIQRLISRLGLELDWLEARMGVLVGGRLWPFTSPRDLLRFKPLPVHDRIRTGLGAVAMGRRRDWEPLDRLSAYDWLRRHCGRRASAVVWEPLLRAKFGPAAPEVPAAWMYGRFSQRSGARTRRGRERFGYLRGGFRRMFDALAVELEGQGVSIQPGTRAESILFDDHRARAVRSSGGVLEADAIVYTGALPHLAPLVQPELRDPRWTQIGGLGALVGLLELEGPVTDYYWTNVCDDEVPFGGMIEHTNLVPASDYGGRHVLYLGRYFTEDDDIARSDKDVEVARWVDALAEILPRFDHGQIHAFHAFRTPYAAPLVTLGHLTRMPPLRAATDGLYVSTTAQIYPQDRGMSDGVRMGYLAADAVLTDLGSNL